MFFGMAKYDQYFPRMYRAGVYPNMLQVVQILQAGFAGDCTQPVWLIAASAYS